MKHAILPVFTIVVALLSFSCGDRKDDANTQAKPDSEQMKRVVTVLQSDG